MYEARRTALLDQLSRLGGVAVIPTNAEHLRSGDTHYRFRAGNNLYYLTGFAEPGAVLVLTPFHPQHHYVLFVRPRDPEQETWHGRRAGVEGAIERFGADVAWPIEELEARLPEYLRHARTLYYPQGSDPEMDRKVFSAGAVARRFRKEGSLTPDAVVDPGALLAERRLFKTPDELALLQKAADITSQAHIVAMMATRPGMYEYEIEALVEYTFRKSGAVGPAYPSIVGAGDNATILHYVENNAPLRDGELLLVDAGCEYACYNADLTRTWPINGRFSGPQRHVYEVVLAAQQAAINICRVGSQFMDPHLMAMRILTEGMVELGLLQGDVDGLIESGAFKQYYMHRTSHWLGMDVHDVGEYYTGEVSAERTSRPLQPGMLLTIEPGIYIPAHDERAPAGLRGVGVRIEDDVLVTGGAPEVLTARCPKRVSEIEALVGSG